MVTRTMLWPEANTLRKVKVSWELQGEDWVLIPGSSESESTGSVVSFLQLVLLHSATSRVEQSTGKIFISQSVLGLFDINDRGLLRKKTGALIESEKKECEVGDCNYLFLDITQPGELPSGVTISSFSDKWEIATDPVFSVTFAYPMREFICDWVGINYNKKTQKLSVKHFDRLEKLIKAVAQFQSMYQSVQFDEPALPPGLGHAQGTGPVATQREREAGSVRSDSRVLPVMLMNMATAVPAPSVVSMDSAPAAPAPFVASMNRAPAVPTTFASILVPPQATPVPTPDPTQESFTDPLSDSWNNAIRKFRELITPIEEAIAEFEYDIESVPSEMDAELKVLFDKFAAALKKDKQELKHCKDIIKPSSDRALVFAEINTIEVALSALRSYIKSLKMQNTLQQKLLTRTLALAVFCDELKTNRALNFFLQDTGFETVDGTRVITRTEDVAGRTLKRSLTLPLPPVQHLGPLSSNLKWNSEVTILRVISANINEKLEELIEAHGKTQLKEIMESRGLTKIYNSLLGIIQYAQNAVQECRDNTLPKIDKGNIFQLISKAELAVFALKRFIVFCNELVSQGCPQEMIACVKQVFAGIYELMHQTLHHLSTLVTFRMNSQVEKVLAADLQGTPFEASGPDIKRRRVDEPQELAHAAPAPAALPAPAYSS